MQFTWDPWIPCNFWVDCNTGSVVFIPFYHRCDNLGKPRVGLHSMLVSTHPLGKWIFCKSAAFKLLRGPWCDSTPWDLPSSREPGSNLHTAGATAPLQSVLCAAPSLILRTITLFITQGSFWLFSWKAFPIAVWNMFHPSLPLGAPSWPPVSLQVIFISRVKVWVAQLFMSDSFQSHGL